jgi:hypothetical protein
MVEFNGRMKEYMVKYEQRDILLSIEEITS